MKLLFLNLFFIINIFSCSSGSDSSPSSVFVVGTDLSGTYNLAGVECYNTTTGALAQTALLAMGTKDKITISGNSLTSDASYDGSLYSFASKVVFNGDNTVNMTERKFGHVNFGTGSCTAGVGLGNNPVHSITPTIVTLTAQSGATMPNIVSSYVRNNSTGAFGLLSSMTAGSNTLCFYVYTKQ